MNALPATGGGPDYRPVSRLAVAALVVGACSVVSLASVVAWVVPLVGIAVAVAALRHLARPGAVEAGRLAALAGLALSIGFGAQAVTGTLLIRAIGARRAEATAALWMDAVREGRLADALAITSLAVTPSLPGADVDAAGLATFTELAPVRAAAACGGTRPAAARTEPLGTAAGEWKVWLPLVGCGGHEHETLVLTVAPRTLPTPGGAVDRWSVIDLAIDR